MARSLCFNASRCLARRSSHGTSSYIPREHIRKLSSRPAQAPRIAIDIKKIREKPGLYSQNCIQRNYEAFTSYPTQVNTLFQEWKKSEERAKTLRQRSKALQAKLTQQNAISDPEAGTTSQPELLEEARELKDKLQHIDRTSNRLTEEIERLAEALPNLTSAETPIGDAPKLVTYINANKANALLQQNPSTSHVDIGAELDLLDFSAASTVSGWGWYYLKNEAALLEQALVQYALGVAMRHGFQAIAPPSIVYSHIGSACGFQPRDQGGEQQVYALQRDASDIGRGKPELCLAGTAEIPFAGLLANAEIPSSSLPIRVIGSSRCYRAEAGSRGINTKGLYRVHEFTKVEMFGWTLPDPESTHAAELFNSMVAIQTEILQGLGLYCRVLEQPSTDLGASATRKQDIEAFFPSRRERDEGWGEVTSTSICTDYQTRRLATRVKMAKGGKLEFPHTVNGTALAVPRVLAAILETHWDERDRCVNIPRVLWPWMHSVRVIRGKAKRDFSVKLE